MKSTLTNTHRETQSRALNRIPEAKKKREKKIRRIVHRGTAAAGLG